MAHLCIVELLLKNLNIEAVLPPGVQHQRLTDLSCWPIDLKSEYIYNRDLPFKCSVSTWRRFKYLTWRRHSPSVSTACSLAGPLCWRCPLQFPASELHVCLLLGKPAVVAETSRSTAVSQARESAAEMRVCHRALTSIFSGPCIFSCAANAFLKGVGVLGVGIVTVLRNVGVRELKWQRMQYVVHVTLRWSAA